MVEALEAVRAAFLVVSFSSDWLYPTAESKAILRALQANGVPTTYLDIPNDYGHDAFLLPNQAFSEAVSSFLDNVQRRVRSDGGVDRGLA